VALLGVGPELRQGPGRGGQHAKRGLAVAVQLLVSPGSADGGHAWGDQAAQLGGQALVALLGAGGLGLGVDAPGGGGDAVAGVQLGHQVPRCGAATLRPLCQRSVELVQAGSDRVRVRAQLGHRLDVGM
jgi:hypothetical protein